MRRPARRHLLAVVGVALVLAVPLNMVGLFPGPSGRLAAPLGSPIAAPHAGATPHASAASPNPPTVTPAVTVICNPPPGYPFYVTLGGVLPLTPKQSSQVPCPRIDQDEVHASYFSSVPGSAQRFTVPVNLPVDGTTHQVDAYGQFDVGMVVKGDTFSAWRQSYLSEVFVPTGSGGGLTFTGSLHIFSMVNDTLFGGVGCPGSAMNFSWNNSYFCEIDDMAVTNSTTYPAGDSLSVTFAGVRGATSGMNVWINDSTSAGLDRAWVLDNTTTGTWTFEPYFNAACPDSCILNWSLPLGLGELYTLCPFSGSLAPPPSCDSFNETTWRGTHHPEFGIPQFFKNGAYSGDYYYFAPLSGSGVCNPNYSPGIVAVCFLNDVFPGTGYYPYFTYNGTVLDFGSNWTWTTEEFGGPSLELLSTGGFHDIVPFFFYTVTNTSRASFVPSGQSVTVTTELQDLGSVTGATLSYQVQSGPMTSVGMPRISGSASDGVYSATIPAGANGWVNYTVNATNGAGAAIRTGTYHLQRGPLPTFSVSVGTSLGPCGGIDINGTVYANASTAMLLPGSYPILAVGCYPYVFSRWTLSPGLSITPFGAIQGTLEVTAGGSISESWVYVRPPDTIHVYTNPSVCGQVIVASVFFNNGQLVSPAPLDGLSVSLSYLGCGGKVFAGWNITGNFTILGGSSSTWGFIPHGNGSITANFVDSGSASSIVFYTDPTNCGGVLFEGVGYSNGVSISLVPGAYTIGGDPCPHYGLLSFTTTGGLSVSGTTLTVTSAGTITAVQYHLTEVTFSIAGCGTVYWDGTAVHDTQVISVANNSVHTVTGTACVNWYLFNITGSGGVDVLGNTATVNGSGVVTATFIPGTPNQIVAFLTDPPECGTIIFAGVSYINSNYTKVAPHTVATISAVACGGYGFVEWITYGGITVAGSTAYLNDSGAIQAIFRPIATLFLFTSPIGCGSVSVAGVNYLSNATVDLTEFRNYAVTAVACAGYGFTNWVNSSGVQLPAGPGVGSGVLVLSASAVLTAIFVPIKYTVSITVSPSNCGGLRVAGQIVGNGSVLSLSGGSYSLIPSPCPGDHLVRWTVTGNVSVVNTTLWVNGSGSVEALFQPVPPSVTLSISNSSFSGVPVPFGATVAVLVPPYTYSYLWTFGDGTSVTTPVNFTSHEFRDPGTFHVSVEVTDAYNRSANATGAISIIAQSTAASFGFTTLSIAVVVLAAVLVAAVFIVGSRFRRPPPAPETTPAPPTTYEYDNDSNPNPAPPSEMEAPKP
ncbi:MAG TPA: PKD domain-containing protein [Thermoplasmata archaeon]